ncbi:MAG: hypothetical protein ACLGH8_05035 [Bacteroidia bacterium]
MKNIYKWLLPVLLLSAYGASAQCAMCRAALESNEQGIQPEAVNDGIVYLMAFPYLLVGLVGFIVYRMMSKRNKKGA